MKRLSVALGAALLALLAAVPARAEYRAYELEVVQRYDCRLNKREVCRNDRLVTAMPPRQFLLTHGGSYQVGVMLLATWMCYGDTSAFKTPCPRPKPRTPRFAEGDTVQITLGKHITEGWQGKVEVAYYQASVHSNVYGVRFADRRGVYARYYEKDLRKIAGAPAAAAGSAAAGGTATAATTAGVAGTPPGGPSQ